MVQSRDRAEKTDGVGVLRAREQFIHGGALDDLAGVHHRDLVADLGDHAEIVSDEDNRSTALRFQFMHQIEDLRLQGDVECGRGFIGDQEPGIAGQRHRDHDPLAHSAGELVGIFVDAPFRRGDMNATKQFDRACSRGVTRTAAMAQDGFDDLVADGEARVERGHRLLEDHRETVAAEVAQDLVRHFQQVKAVKTDRSRDLCRLFRQ